jgi:hypothetical protein
MGYFMRLGSFRFVKKNLGLGSFLNPTENEDLRIAKFSLHRTTKENCGYTSLTYAVFKDIGCKDRNARQGYIVHTFRIL